MRAGELIHWLVVEQKTIATDTTGNRTETWAMFAEVWGRITSGQGREFFDAKQVIADLSHSILIRYTASMREDMRIKYTDDKTGANVDRYFNIRSIANPDERNLGMVLLCTEVRI